MEKPIIELKESKKWHKMQYKKSITKAESKVVKQILTKQKPCTVAVQKVWDKAEQIRA